MALSKLEYSEGNNRFESIDTQKLSRELGAHPRDFSKQKKQFSELITWFEESIIQDDALEGMKIDSDPEKIKRLIKKMEAIGELYLLPLFARYNPHISDLAWTAFVDFYLTQYVRDNLKYRWEFLKTVTAENIYDKVSEERDKELRMIFGVLFGESILQRSAGLDDRLLLEGITRLEEKYVALQQKDQKRFDEATRKAWQKKGLSVTALFAGNIVSKEDPGHDMPYLDEFLCYHDSMFFPILMRDAVLENTVLMQQWIVARSDLLANTSSETYKIFCDIFYLGEEGLFDDEGDILVDASIKIHGEFSESLAIVERKRKNLILRERYDEERKRIEDNIRKRVVYILSQKIVGVCDENFVIGLQDVAPEISAIDIDISRNGKSHARTMIRPPFGESIDLKACLFETFNPQNNEQSWNMIADWKGGENYKISLRGRIGTQKTPENELYKWKEKKIEPVKKDTFIAPIVIPPNTNVSQLVSTVSASMTTITISQAISAAPEATEAPKDPKESEKEDLHAALEFFLEKSDQELMSFFQEHTQWDTDTQVLTLHIPVEELEEMGYTPSLLSVSEYGPMIQWSVKREKEKWVPKGDAAPEKIQTYYESIFRALSEQIERGEIDNYLSEIGLSPSETSDNSALKGAIRIQENIDIKKLDTGIRKMSEKYIQDGAHYNIYSGPPAKDGTPTSISWFSKKQWRATLTLQPEIKIDLTPSSNQSLPYNASLLGQRMENALLNFIYQYIKNEKGVSGIIKRTSAQEDTKRLRESYRRELKKKTARLLIENTDGTFTIIEGISTDALAETIGNAQRQYGKENIALLYRRNTYTFLGDTSICKPSQSRSDDDYISLNLAERRNIIRERVLKSLFNGKSGIQDRAPFLHNSAVYHALQFEAKAFQEQIGRNITKEDITDEFLEKFITILRSRQILISYRDYCAGEVEDLTDLVGE